MNYLEYGKKLFLLMFPGGHPWTFIKEFGAIIKGIGKSIGRAIQYVDQSKNEANPLMANDTLPDWYSALGIRYDETQTLVNRQRRASQVFTAIGGQSLDYVQSRVQVAFPDITLEEYKLPYTNMVGLGMVGQMQVTDYPGWIPAPSQDGTYPIYLYKVTGTVENVFQFLQLQDILVKIAPLRLEPVFVDINFEFELGVVGLGQVGAMQVGRNQI
jgi:hypothetical protein